MVVWGEGEFCDGHGSVQNNERSRLQPPPPGQKRVKEEWESLWYWGMYGSMALAAVLLYYKPDSRSVTLASHAAICGSGTDARPSSIQTWALKEAKARMEARGEAVEYKPSS